MTEPHDAEHRPQFTRSPPAATARYVEERRFSEIGKIRMSKEVTGMCVDASARGQAAITLHAGRVEVPIILAVDDVDRCSRRSQSWRRRRRSSREPGSRQLFELTARPRA